MGRLQAMGTIKIKLIVTKFLRQHITMARIKRLSSVISIIMYNLQPKSYCLI